ncbi:hypothetical protein BC826DRAFT_1046124 [Russula brevipes]|nr:hypothetical protein BC826DRAFT_1046124 [Russula brevipes]
MREPYLRASPASAVCSSDHRIACGDAGRGPRGRTVENESGSTTGVGSTEIIDRAVGTGKRKQRDARGTPIKEGPDSGRGRRRRASRPPSPRLLVANRDSSTLPRTGTTTRGTAKPAWLRPPSPHIVAGLLRLRTFHRSRKAALGRLCLSPIPPLYGALRPPSSRSSVHNHRYRHQPRRFILAQPKC